MRSTQMWVPDEQKTLRYRPEAAHRRRRCRAMLPLVLGLAGLVLAGVWILM